MRKIIVWMFAFMVLFTAAYAVCTGSPGAAADASAAASAVSGITTGTATTQTPITRPPESYVNAYEDFPSDGTVLRDNDPSLQTALNNLGYNNPDPDQNIKDFQEDFGLTANGEAGKGTLGVINDLYHIEKREIEAGAGNYNLEVAMARKEGVETLYTIAGLTDPKNLQDLTLDKIDNAERLVDDWERTGQITPEEAAMMKDDLLDVRLELEALESVQGMNYDDIQKGIDEGTISPDIFDYMKKYDEDLAKQMREQRRASNLKYANDYWSWLRPNAVGYGIQDWVNSWFNHDVGYNILEEGPEWIKSFVGYAISGYETAICDAAYDIPEQVIQDYPGHYVSGAGYLGSILVLLGRRTEYISPDSQTGWFFELMPDRTIKEKGYLYKVSYTISNRYSQAQYDDMQDYEREDAGLMKDGVISYTLTISGTKPDGSAASYVWDSLPNISLGAKKSQTFAFYDKAKLTTLKFKFNNGYKYDGTNSEKTATIVVKDLQSNVPATFSYNPPAEQVGAITYTYPDGSVVNTTSTQCNGPPDWCCNQGIVSYC